VLGRRDTDRAAGDGRLELSQWVGSGVVAELAVRRRVCTYDRAGTGSSDAAPNERREADDVVKEAHALLVAAHVAGPLMRAGDGDGAATSAVLGSGSLA
jgi:hypothetical protein